MGERTARGARSPTPRAGESEWVDSLMRIRARMDSSQDLQWAYARIVEYAPRRLRMFARNWLICGAATGTGTLWAQARRMASDIEGGLACTDLADAAGFGLPVPGAAHQIHSILLAGGVTSSEQPEAAKERTCAVCGKTFARTGVKTCSRVCGNRMATAARTKSVAPKRKTCKTCATEYERIAGESRAAYLSRKNCKQCQGASADSGGERVCTNCGEEFERRDGELRSDYRKRSRCSRVCGGIPGIGMAGLDVLGVRLTVRQIAAQAGVTEQAIRKRARNGRNPLTGKRLPEKDE